MNYAIIGSSINEDTATPIRLYNMVTNDLGTYLGKATGAIGRDKVIISFDKPYVYDEMP